MNIKRIIVHVDMDAFFAAVEELGRPELKGKPVIIGSDPKEGHGRGVVSTANYEARKYGIHSAMPISKAYRLCPKGIYISPEHSKYSEKSREIMEILNSFSPLVEQVSIDEAFLDCTGCEALFGNPQEIGMKIKAKIYSRTGLTASIGIAGNKSVAKIASDYQKPDGLTIVEPGKEKDFLYPLPINKLWGIGKKSQEYLNSLNIYYVKDIILKHSLIKERMGKHGRHIWEMANGIDDRPVISTMLSRKNLRKSISKERTFNEDITDRGQCERIILELSEDIAARLRKEKLAGRTISIKVRLEDFTTFSRSITLDRSTNETKMIQDCALSLFGHFDNHNRKFRLIGVHISGLGSEDGIQPSLLATAENRQKKLDRLMDEVKKKFGKKSISRRIY